jgi:hypothetical protein
MLVVFCVVYMTATGSGTDRAAIWPSGEGLVHFGLFLGAAPPRHQPKPSLAGPEIDRAREALSKYNGALQQLISGNWAGLGAELDALLPLLEEMSQHSASC